MRLKDKFIAMGVAITLCTTVGIHSVINYAQPEINMVIDDEKIPFGLATGMPFADENNRTQVPLRLVMEKIGADVKWVQEENKTIISKGDSTVEVMNDKTFIVVNGEVKNIDTTPVVKDERTYLPIRCVVEALGGSVDWNQQECTVIINSNNEIDDKENKENKKEANATIKGNYVNVRTHMNTSSEVAYQVNNGDRINISKKIRSWYEVKDNNKTYYIFSDYVTLDDGVQIEVEEIKFDTMPTVEKLTSEWALKYFYSKTLGTDTYNDLIYEVAVSKGLNPVFIKCLMILESGGNLKTASKPNSNGVYYVGLMQVASNYGFDNEKILSDPKYALECGIEVVNRKIQASKAKGNTPTIYEVAWRYNSYSEAGRPYAEKVSKLYEELTGSSREDSVLLQ